MPSPARRLRAPRRYYYHESSQASMFLKEAISDRRLAARAATDFERKFHRSNMRYAAREAVAECRRYLRRRYGDEHV